MSTRGSTWWDDDLIASDWVAEPKPWCQFCMTASCGCPHEPTLEIPPNITLGEE